MGIYISSLLYANATTEVDLVEKDVLLRRIRAEKRDLNRKPADFSVQRALLQNNV